jgi:5-methylcytosine-specific restriction endonuclease McrA
LLDHRIGTYYRDIMKICCKCKETKPVSEFSKQSSSKDGLRRTCRACCAAYRKSERGMAVLRAWNAKNAESIRKKKRAWVAMNPDKTLEHSRRDSALGRKRREALIRSMGGCCERCGYNTYSGAMDFHHIDPRTKKKHIRSSSFTRKYAETLQEATKTAVLCCRCHRELHAGLWGIERRDSNGELVLASR